MQKRCIHFPHFSVHTLRRMQLKLLVVYAKTEMITSALCKSKFGDVIFNTGFTILQFYIQKPVI